MSGPRTQDPVLRFTERLRSEHVNMHGFHLTAAGEDIVRAYYAPFREGQPHRLYSVSKTLTGIAVGILMDEGKLSLEDPVSGFFPDWLPKRPAGALLRLTLRDMLRMATCYRKTAYREGIDDNWARAFFMGTPDHEPGTVFAYDTGCSQVLAALVYRISGSQVMDFLEKRLFTPLGCLDRRYWLRDPSGCCQGGTGLCMSLRDFHRVAVCLLDGGDGLIPAWYVREMARKQIETPLQDKEEEKYGYGWQCWRTRAGWSMYGMGGQLAVICPDRQAVLSTVADTRLDPQGVQRIYDAFFEEIYPALPFPDIPSGNDSPFPEALNLPAEKLNDSGEYTPSGLGIYDFADSNPLGLKALALTETQLLLERDRDTAVLAFRRGEALETGYPGRSGIPAVTSAAWIGEGLLRIRCNAIGDSPCGFDMLISLQNGRITVQSKCSSDPLTRGYDGFASGVLRAGETA